MADIFLSYAEEDRESARRIVSLLESTGWSVWWDRRIPAGKTWRAVLDAALAEMQCMLVLWSKRSVTSDWVIEEAEEARSRQKLLPILLEAVLPPRGFREIQALDFSDWDRTGDATCFRLLIGDLESFIGKPRTLVAATGPVAAIAPVQPVSDAGQHPRQRDAKSSEDPWHRIVETSAADEPSAMSDRSEQPEREALGTRLARWTSSRRIAFGLGVTVLSVALIWLFLGITPRPDSKKERAPETDAIGVAPGVADLARRTPEQASETLPAKSAAVRRKSAEDESAQRRPYETSSAPSTAAAKSTRIEVDRQTAAERRSAGLRLPPRCRDLLARAQLGEPLSADEQAFLQEECK